MISFREYVERQMKNKMAVYKESLRDAVLYGNKPKPVVTETATQTVIEAVKAAPVKKITVRELLQRGGITLKKLKNAN